MVLSHLMGDLRRELEQNELTRNQFLHRQDIVGAARKFSSI
jgi:hypothetical protein